MVHHDLLARGRIKEEIPHDTVMGRGHAGHDVALFTLVKEGKAPGTIPRQPSFA